MAVRADLLKRSRYVMKNTEIRKRMRRGTAAAEAAVILPLVVAVMVGSIELCGGVHQQCRLRSVLHECSKLAAKGEATCLDVKDLADGMLTQLDIDDYTIQMVVVPRTVNQSSVETPTETSFVIVSDGSLVSSGLDEVPRGTVMRMTMTAERPPIATPVSFLAPQITTNAVFVKEI